MTDSTSLPPSTALLNAVINDPAIGDAEFRTYARLYALAWRYDYQRTDPLDYETEIIPLIGSHGAARRHMNKLHAAGYLDWTTNGAHRYIFTFPSPTGASPKSGTREPNQPEDGDDPSPTNGTPGTKSGTCKIEPSPKSGTPGTKNGTRSPKSGTRKPPIRPPVPPGTVPTEDRSGEVNLINLINLTSPNLTSDPLLEKILAATTILFGESVYRPKKQITYHTLLAHLAQAYHERKRGLAGYRGRMACKRMNTGWRPEPAYQADPFAFLPAEFLQAAGLEAFIPVSEHPDEPDDEQQPAEQPAQTDPSAIEPIWPGGPTPAYAWGSARGQLQSEMSKAAFDQYVHPAVVARYHDGIFWIRAANSYARDWLQSRMTSTIARLLTGICNRTVDVRFLCDAKGGD